MTGPDVASQEGAVYARYILSSLDRLMECIEGMEAAQWNWRPPAPETNSVYVLAVHTLGNAEENILGTVCGQPVMRDHARSCAGVRGTGGIARCVAPALGRIAGAVGGRDVWLVRRCSGARGAAPAPGHADGPGGGRASCSGTPRPGRIDPQPCTRGAPAGGVATPAVIASVRVREIRGRHYPAWRQRRQSGGARCSAAAGYGARRPSGTIARRPVRRGLW